MATPGQWLAGARPRTLPAAVAPVLAGTGAAALVDDVRTLRAVLALVVSLALQVAVNYANDYSDGVRGTDAHRVGPLRLVGSGAASPGAVKRASFAAFGVAGAAGLALAAMTSWWLIAVGLAAILAAWGYTGGPKPYGYWGFGEVFVFTFFGLVAVCGTTYVQVGRITGVSIVCGVAIGMLACALLVANNLRDIPTDAVAGKRTLAVRIGEQRTRVLYVSLLVLPFVAAIGLAIAESPWVLVSLLALPLAFTGIRPVLKAATGRALIPVLQATGRTELVFAVGLLIGLALSN